MRVDFQFFDQLVKVLAETVGLIDNDHSDCLNIRDLLMFGNSYHILIQQLNH